MINQADVLRGHMEHIGGCGDGGCIVHVRPGMHTNGGCGCSRNPHTMFQVVHWHKRAVASQAAEIERLRGILKRVTPDPVWGEDPISQAYYKEARAALQPKEGEG